jgi:hypothetical protein
VAALGLLLGAGCRRGRGEGCAARAAGRLPPLLGVPLPPARLLGAPPLGLLLGALLPLGLAAPAAPALGGRGGAPLGASPAPSLPPPLLRRGGGLLRCCRRCRQLLGLGGDR